MEEILLNIGSKETRYAQLKNGVLYDLVVEQKNTRQLTGNIYKGSVTNILHNIQSAFIDINEGENGFIHISDILENIKKFEQLFDLDFQLGYDIKEMSQEQQQNTDIDKLMKIHQSVLVQVIKEPIGSKGARLTSNVSIAGRYLVLLPNAKHRGVSRKIESYSARDRLKKIIRSLELPQEMGLICRTASRNATAEMLQLEAEDLMQTWESIITAFNKHEEPTCLYQESELIKKAVLTAVDKKFSRILIDDYQVYQKSKRIYNKYAHEHPLRIEYYRDTIPMFERFNIEKEIERSLRRKIWLPSGGYLFFDRTEAMSTIDVNSGRSTKSVTDVEESIVRINLEATEEIVRQLRLRNIGGLIICDFIDMRARKNQRRILEQLKSCMKEDYAKCTILGMSEFGLIEMTRQRQRESLAQTMLMPCPYCNGNGEIKTLGTVTAQIERALRKVVLHSKQHAIKLAIHPHLMKYLTKEDDKDFLIKLATKLNANLEFETDDKLHLNDFSFYSTTNNKKIDV